MEDELRLVFEAEKEAGEIISKAERDASAIGSEARRESDGLRKSSREQALKEGEKIVARRVADAEEEGTALLAEQKAKMAEMEANAASRMRDATDLILRSILEGT